MRRFVAVLAGLIALALLAPAPVFAKRKSHSRRHVAAKNRHLSQAGPHIRSHHAGTGKRKRARARKKNPANPAL